MFDDVGKAIEYLRLNSDDTGDAAIRCIEEELARLYVGLATAYNHMTYWMEKLDSIEESVIALHRKI